MKSVLILAFVLVASSVVADDWVQKAPRDEISAEFERDGDDLILKARDAEGINGYWEREFKVTGGDHVRFFALRKAQNIEHERRSCVVRIEWYTATGARVQSPHKINPAYFGSETGSAQPDFPGDREVRRDGWTHVEGSYEVPEKAEKAFVQLHLRWAPGGSVTWRKASLAKTQKPLPRRVTLAAVHFNLPGSGRSVVENREAFAPLISQAAEQGAELIVLPELLTCKGVTHDYVSVAETIPGPSTKYFGKLAKKHDCYLVVGLPERAGHLVYNVAVLLGPDGEVVGKYRKVTLPREEIARGIAPGKAYPVFETRFGKVGMMVCYDVFFPEVARELAMNGAEIIAMPIWGGNPRLAAARCAENGVYLVSSTYTNHESDWMKTAIWNREGDRIAEADKWGSVVVKEVDLNQPTYWYGLGDFQSRIKREAPIRVGE